MTVLSVLGAQPTIQIHIDESTIFLHPSPLPEHIPTNDPILRGVVVLTLPKPKRIKSVVVRLVGYYNLATPDYAYESGQTMETEVSIVSSKEEERLFDKGVHAFAFTLVVPASTAPFERCQYGRVYHKLYAFARGSGMINADVHTEKEVWLVVNPADEGEMQDHNSWIEGFHEEIGPYAISTASQNLTVGGLLHYDLLLACPPSDTEIHSISAHISTTYTLTSYEHPKRPIQRAGQRRHLFLLDHRCPPQTPRALLQSLSPTCDPLPLPSTSTTSPSVSPSHTRIASPTSPRPQPVKSNSTRTTSVAPRHLLPTRRASAAPGLSKVALPTSDGPLPPLCTISANVPYQTSHLTRLPNDDFIRPSTLPGTKTPVRVTHELILEVRFRPLTGSEEDTKPAKLRVLKVTRPIIISSCCCMIENLLVPSYSVLDNKPEEADLVPFFDVCQCTAATDKLILEQLAAGSLQEKFENAGAKAEYRISPSRGLA